MLGAVEGAGGRISLNLSRFFDPAGKPVATWAADGHDLGFHPYFTVDEDPDADFTEGYTRVANHFATAMPGIVPGPTARHHAGEWAGWIDPVAVMPGFGVRMNLDYYTAGPAVWNPTVDQQAHGYINGTGLPMRFVTTTGQVSPVYQQTTSLSVDQLVQGTHSEHLDPAEALAVSRQLIDDSQAGGYSAIATQFQVDFYPFDEVKPWVDGTLAYAAGQQVPIWTAERWLEFTEARAASTITNYSWNAGTGLLSFSLTVPAGAAAQSLMVPPAFAGKVLSNATIDGTTVVPAALAVNGRISQVIQVAPGAGGAARQVVLRYVLASSLPTVSIADAAAVEGNSGTSVVSLTVSLSAPSATDVIMGVVASNGTAAAGLDYQPIASGFVLIPASATSAPVQVTIIGDTNYEADETVIVTLSNPVGATLADATGVLTIQNDEPVIAVADAYGTPFNTPLNVAAPGVLANDNAIGQPGLVAVLVSTTPNGSLTLGADGAVSYTPNLGFAGVDSFTYRGDTSIGTGNTVTVTITVAEPTVVQPPSELRASSIAGNIVTFRWKAPPIGPRPVGYVLEGGVAPAQPLVALATGQSAPIFQVTAPNGSFYVRIRSLGIGGPSDVSNEILIHVGVPVAPSAPSGFQATAVGDGVHLAWTPTFAGGAPDAFVLDVAGSACGGDSPAAARARVVCRRAGRHLHAVAARHQRRRDERPECAGGDDRARELHRPDRPADQPAGLRLGRHDLRGVGSADHWRGRTSYVISVPGIGGFPLAQRTISGPLPAGSYTINVQAVGPCGTSAPVTFTLTVP